MGGGVVNGVVVGRGVGGPGYSEGVGEAMGG